MYKTLIISVQCNNDDAKYLLGLNRESASVWNRCVEIDQEFSERNNRVIKPSELQSALLGFSYLPRASVYHVYRKYIAARHSMFQSISKHHKTSQSAKIPYKPKTFFNTGWDRQVIKTDYLRNTISLIKKKGVDENGKQYRQQPVVCHAQAIPQNIVEIELLYRDGLKLAIKYKESDINHLVPSGNSAAIDLGEIHSIASIDNFGHAIIITGRKLRSIKRFRDKEQAKLRSKMSRCTKGSRQYRKYAKAKWKLQYKADNQIKDAIHKTTKLYLDYCIEHNITTVYYGDLDSCTRNTNGRVSLATGQKLNEWSHGAIVRQLENKLGRYGIELIQVDEAYTSRKCPACGSHNKTVTRNYRCECGYEQHRDLVGAINLENQNSGTELIRYTDKRYLRIA